ncbi:hypothetical protein PV04_06593 [Phialophora macrospora]|uniref:Uncharacterized protein n=1 Tax=Phialophora macrospora TaxID=1851006 RepID=A0A0D2FKR1_9EURO|nr:hypothetical protein PV04_06593 [Phialophora macrospora]
MTLRRVVRAGSLAFPSTATSSWARSSEVFATASTTQTSTAYRSMFYDKSIKSYLPQSRWMGVDLQAFKLPI